MALEESLIDLERFCAKAWRVYAKEDPLSHLSFNEFDYLRVIQVFPEGVRITDLADELQVTKPSASNMVMRLEKKGLVKRIACNEDARAKRVLLTEDVAEKMSLEQIVYKDISDQMMLKLDEQEAKQLQSLLNKALGN
ncbi:MarR family winged helix-turn-helix transcriptional regulator [Vibrio parahaemolyticus]|uniref:MarR family winged helix-turn-helix transcriptional regulator n=1 Tax=Vibrio parahaemolyticus TaxID=670 RepID=UPI00112067B0|nr:MarR family transcriptional regulator [Vibrio parahaemolyticus]EJG1632927.1 MarR family transcriptional regulator [Vibrio parahaemolyticus]ELA7159849.1 MarR family transcriptional regulator [Vibrio parahaemolyticus]ELA8130348.1 MarR family transcriptional regulator [Vibrio parahaemolyticus]ELB2964827.1 MarR family transcriptional regulator [Vibrio parahaemolyticus]EMC9922309.1 MarR family transcriptional regulator [Vibrio parahaemolyticus]